MLRFCRFCRVEKIVDVPVHQERIVPMEVPQVIQQLMEVATSSSQERILKCTREQFLVVPVPHMIEKVGVVPEISSKGRILQRTKEQFLDVPVPLTIGAKRKITKSYSPAELILAISWLS